MKKRRKKTELQKLKDKALELWKFCIKERAHWTCEICGKSKPFVQIHPHHFYTSAITSTCYDLDNGFCLCAYHHKGNKEISGHTNPDAFRDWAIKTRGQEWYSKLKEKSKQIVHYKIFDYIEIIQDLQKKIGRLK